MMTTANKKLAAIFLSYCCITSAFLWLVHSLGRWTEFIDALSRLKVTLVWAALAMASILGLTWLAISFVLFVQDTLQRNRWASTITLCAFTCTLFINAFPIVAFLGWFSANVPEKFYFLILILSNLLLFSLFSQIYQEVEEESQKLYVISAPFRNSTRRMFVSEKLTWCIFSNIRPVFYQAFTYSIFLDLYLGDQNKGIVGHIFLEMTKGDRTKLLICFCVVILSFQLVRPILELPEYIFLKKREMTTSRETA